MDDSQKSFEAFIAQYAGASVNLTHWEGLYGQYESAETQMLYDAYLAGMSQQPIRAA